jgi:hypothetical protein
MSSQSTGTLMGSFGSSGSSGNGFGSSSSGWAILRSSGSDRSMVLGRAVSGDLENVLCSRLLRSF